MRYGLNRSGGRIGPAIKTHTMINYGRNANGASRYGAQPGDWRWRTAEAGAWNISTTNSCAAQPVSQIA